MESLAVVLIRNDRRLIDHEGLFLTKEFDRFLILAILPVQWEMSNRISEIRKTFILSGINHFAKSLGTVPVHFSQNPKAIIDNLVGQFDVTVLAEEQGASEEQKELDRLSVRVIKTRANTLFETKKRHPTFTPFRQAVEKEEVLPPLTVVLDETKSLILKKFLFKPFSVPDYQNPHKRVDYYLKQHLAEYPETRNYLESENGSSKFSYFLAGGELSVRYLYQKINELSPGNWLGVELLWREFFWQHGVDFTLPSKGINIPGWESQLQHPLAQAIYNELVSTGYISNRSRQILASYLVYEIGLDWKMGAAFYEKHLLDYDVFVNWGNWQYIAGVKFDPRGGRKFNLDLQVEKYDPACEYMKKWAKLL